MASLNPFKRSRRGPEEPAAEVVLSPEAEVAAIELQIAAAAKEEADALHEADPRDKQRELRQRASEAAERRKRLQQQLAVVRHREMLPRVAGHARKLASIARTLIETLNTAATLNSAAALAFQNARRDLGDEFAMRYLHQVVFNGLIREDLVTVFAREILAQLASTDRKLSGIVPIAEDQLARVAESRRESVAVLPAPTKKAPPNTVPSASAEVPQSVLPPEDEPLTEGQVRVRVLLAGWPPADDKAACRVGQHVVLARKHAEYVATRGCVEIIEEFVPSPAASGEPSNEGAAK